MLFLYVVALCSHSVWAFSHWPLAISFLFFAFSSHYAGIVFDTQQYKGDALLLDKLCVALFALPIRHQAITILIKLNTATAKYNLTSLIRLNGFIHRHTIQDIQYLTATLWTFLRFATYFYRFHIF